MDDNKRIDIYLGNYYYELSKREQLKIETNYHVGVIALIFSAYVFFVKNFLLLSSVNKFNFNIINVIFIILFFISILSLIISIIFIGKSYHNYDYKLIALPEKIEEQYKCAKNDYENRKKYYKELEIFNRKNGIYEKISKKTENDFETLLIKNIGDVTKINQSNNSSRANFLHNARNFFILALLLLTLIGLVFSVKEVIRLGNDENKKPVEPSPTTTVLPITSQKKIPDTYSKDEIRHGDIPSPPPPNKKSSD